MDERGGGVVDKAVHGRMGRAGSRVAELAHSMRVSLTGQGVCAILLEVCNVGDRDAKMAPVVACGSLVVASCISEQIEEEALEVARQAPATAASRKG